MSKRKRQRIPTTVSISNINVLINQLEQPLNVRASAAKKMKPVVDQEESSQTNQIEPSVMLKLAEAAVQIENYNEIKGSSATTGDDHQGPQRQHELASFLGKCHFCQKKIPYDKNVYMYGDLRGFCSVKCSEAQMHEEIKTGPPQNTK